MEACFVNNELKIEKDSSSSDVIITSVTLFFRLDEDTEKMGVEDKWYTVGDYKGKRLPIMEIKFTLHPHSYPSSDIAPSFELIGFWSQFKDFISNTLNPLYF